MILLSNSLNVFGAIFSRGFWNLNKDSKCKELILKKSFFDMILKYLTDQQPVPHCHGNVDDRDMFLLSGRRDAVPQGQVDFPTLMDQAEYWRENLAIFRSSLS